jgi:iron(III) transport system permease protein
MNRKRLLVFIIPVIIVLLLPVALLFVESFRNEAGAVSLDALKGLFLSSRQITLFWNSLALSAGAACGALLIGVPFALLINRTDLPFKTFFQAAYLVPLFIPPYMQAIVWTKLFSQGRIVWSDAMAAGIQLPSIYSIPGGIFIYSLSFFPFVVLLTSSGLWAVSSSQEEASLLNKGIFRTIRSITLPLITPHITSSAILVFIFSMVNFEVADILRLRVYPVEIFINFSAYYNERAATVLSVPLITVALFLIWGQMIHMKGKSYICFSGRNDKGTYALGFMKPFCFIFVTVVIVVAVIIPVFALMKGAGTAENFMQAFQSAKEGIRYSILVASASAFIMVILSSVFAYYLERTRGGVKTAIDFMTQIPFGIPSIVLGIGLIKIWNRAGFDWIYGTSGILIIGCVTAYSPFVIRIMSTKIKQISRECEEAGILGTGSWFRVLTNIIIPLSFPGMVAGFFTGFALSLSNLGTALLVVSPGRETVPIRIYNFMHYGAEETVFALNILMIGIIGLCFFCAYAGYRFAMRRAGQ